MSIEGKPSRLSRKAFIGLGGMSAAALAVGANYRGPLHALGARAAGGLPPSAAPGYGPLVPKGDLRLPAEFNYQIIDRQGIPMRDGRLTPGIFDAMGAYPDTGGGVNPPGDTTILIRNHENRERPGEIKVVTGPAFKYDETAFGGCTKLVVEREKAGTDPATGQQLYTYTVVDRFAILGGTSTNCVGGELPFKKWMTSSSARAQARTTRRRSRESPSRVSSGRIAGLSWARHTARPLSLRFLAVGFLRTSKPGAAKNCKLKC